jgi:hypothetical protein
MNYDRIVKIYQMEIIHFPESFGGFFLVPILTYGILFTRFYISTALIIKISKFFVTIKEANYYLLTARL